MDVPWKDAKIVCRVIPQQEMMSPRPVTLQCRDCGDIGYWYPGENEIDIGRRVCFYDSSGHTRGYHLFEVVRWNGNVQVNAPTARSD